MTIPGMMRSYGEEVIALDRHGRFDCRGIISGRIRGNQEISYGVKPNGEQTIIWVPEWRIRSVSEPAVATPYGAAIEVR